MMTRRFLFALVLLIATFATNAFAITADKDGWYHTGDAVRTKTIFNVKVYAIGHDMKCIPPQKSKRAVIDADCDKRFVWTMKRDVEKQKIIDALKEAYAMNAYTDAAKINQALAAFNTDFVDGKQVIISYNAANKTTTFWKQDGGTATVAGIEFMKGTWSIWFGKIDPPSIGDSLIANL